MMMWRVTVLVDDGRWLPLAVEADSMEGAVASVIDRRGVANVVECEPWEAWERRHGSRDAATRRAGDAGLGEGVCVVWDGAGLVSRDGLRRFSPYGDVEWAWWVEVGSDGEELSGLWELQDNALVVRVCG